MLHLRFVTAKCDHRAQTVIGPHGGHPAFLSESFPSTFLFEIHTEISAAKNEEQRIVRVNGYLRDAMAVLTEHARADGGKFRQLGWQSITFEASYIKTV